jgi:transposase
MPHATIGIDVGKYEHEACLLDGEGQAVGKTVRFPNSREGFRELHEVINRVLPVGQPLTVAVEATGHYGQHVLADLAEMSHATVRYVNPLLVREQSARTLRRLKTDRTDSARIAYTAQATPGLPWSQPQPIRTLTRLHRRLVRSQSFLKQEVINLLDQICPEFTKVFPNPFLEGPRAILERYPDLRTWNRLRIATFAQRLERASRRRWTPESVRTLKVAVAHSIGSPFRSKETAFSLRMLLRQLRLIQEQLSDLRSYVEREYGSDTRAAKLSVLPGMSVFGAVCILAELGDTRRFSRSEQIAALAGLDPSVHQSGEYVRKRGNHISKRGSKYLRTRLFYAARTAIRTDPALRAWADAKRKEGKHYTAVVVAVARKLATRIFHVLKELESGQTKTPLCGGLTGT